MVTWKSYVGVTSASLPHRRWIHEESDIDRGTLREMEAFATKYRHKFPNPEKLSKELAYSGARSACESGLLKDVMGKKRTIKGFTQGLFESEANYRTLLKMPEFH